MYKSSILNNALLVMSGATSIGIGAALLFAPIAFEASVGIDLGEDINLLSEIKAPGGLLLSGGVVMILGVFRTQLTKVSLWLSSLLYLSYGLSRILSIISDGLPHKSLIAATFVEMVIGLLSLVVLIRFERKQHDK